MVKLSDFFSSLESFSDQDKGKNQGISEAEACSYDYLSSNIYRTTANKKELYNEYRDMANYSEVADAIDDIVTEAIVPDQNNQLISMKLLDDDLSSNENIVAILQQEFDYIMNDVLDVNTNLEDLYRKFYIEGELYGELTITPSKKEEGIKDIRILPSYTMMPEYDENHVPNKFIQNLNTVNLSVQATADKKTTSTEIKFDENQIAYVNSGLVNTEKNLVYSNLERAKVAYRQLKWMESAVLIYRITRAPERRIFYIDVGKLPKNKSDSYIKNIIKKYQNKKIYNPTTGNVDVGKDLLHMTEDFYFPRRSDGSGSSVDTLPGAQNLNELGDLFYFLNKLYKSLKVPVSRIKSSSVGGGGEGELGTEGGGTATEVNRDEIKFSKYVDKSRKRFADFFYQVLFTHLKFKGLFDKYNISRQNLAIVFNEGNHWKELVNLNLLTAKIEVFERMAAFPEHFSKEYLMREVMNFNEDELTKNKELFKYDKDYGMGDEPDSEFGDETETEESPEEDIETDDPDTPLPLRDKLLGNTDKPKNKIVLNQKQ
jgi:hypothetical protein